MIEKRKKYIYMELYIQFHDIYTYIKIIWLFEKVTFVLYIASRDENIYKMQM